MTDTTHLKSLGANTTRYAYDAPEASLLERFSAPVRPAGGSMCVTVSCPEFTSLCPKTGQPDFATIEIEYTPRQWCVESKSLKLYMFSFRNHGEFHEACVSRIAQDLIELLDPSWLAVTGKFTPRGGIPIHPRVTYYRPDID